jgi:ubiquinone/menaquinone biosynthesis C-methylase UbiE
MNETADRKAMVVPAYGKRAGRYDSVVNVFSLFRPFGFDIPAWRREAIERLDLRPGDTVVDIGCGTGLNFPFLHQRVGPAGRIIGVDLSPSMLEQARARALSNEWRNVELVCIDAAELVFPPKVDAILSTFALILIPACDQVIARGCDALLPGGRFSVLDMAWPARWSLRWRHLFFFLRSYGVTGDTLRRRPWAAVQQAMRKRLQEYAQTRFFYGFFYIASGRATSGPAKEA